MNTLDQVRAIIADEMGLVASCIGDNQGLGVVPPSMDGIITMTNQQRAQIIVAVCEHFGIAPCQTATHNTLGLRTAAEIAAYVDVMKAQDAQQARQTPRAEAIAQPDPHGLPVMTDRRAFEELGKLYNWIENGAPQFTPHNMIVALQHGDRMARLDQGPITRAEVLARGVDDADDVTALSLIAKLGWPTEAEPMGTNPTHVPLPVGYAADDHTKAGRGEFSRGLLATDAVREDHVAYSAEMRAAIDAIPARCDALADADALDRDLLTHGISVTKDGVRIPPEEFLTPDEIAESIAAAPVAADDVSASPFAFRKKPVTIEAVRFLKIEDGMAHFDVPLARDVPTWINEAIVGPEMEAGSAWIGYPPEGFDGKPTFWIGTLEGAHIASPGDWILRGVKNELYPCKPDIFALTYDPA